MRAPREPDRDADDGSHRSSRPHEREATGIRHDHRDETDRERDPRTAAVREEDGEHEDDQAGGREGSVEL